MPLCLRGSAPLTQAMCRGLRQIGEKKNRDRARIKFLVQAWDRKVQEWFWKSEKVCLWIRAGRSTRERRTDYEEEPLGPAGMPAASAEFRAMARHKRVRRSRRAM